MEINNRKWLVTSNVIGGQWKYGVYRIKDPNAVDHSGNRERHGGWMTSEEEAQKLADQLNKEGETNDA